MINNLKDLRAVLKLCREHGVTDLTIGELSLKMGDAPVKESRQSIPETEESLGLYDNFPQEAMSPERLQFYAMGGTIEGDPFKDEKL